MYEMLLFIFHIHSWSFLDYCTIKKPAGGKTDVCTGFGKTDFRTGAFVPWNRTDKNTRPGMVQGTTNL